MKTIRLSAALVALVILTLATGVAHAEKTAKDNKATGQASIDLMTRSAAHFVASLDEEEQQKAFFDFDDKGRLVHRIAPFPVTGLPFGEMSRGQISLVHTMLGAALSRQGHHKAASIMVLEEILVNRELARDAQNVMHGPDKYRVAVFGKPESGGTWSWRIHGHHLCLAFTVVNGEFYAAGPAFMGAEPHRIAEGPHAGWSVLGAEENLGRALMNALTPEEQTKATLASEMPKDMFSASHRKVDFMGEPKGLATGDLSKENEALLKAIIAEYVNNLPEDLAHTRWETIKAGGWENVRFGWIGGLGEGDRIYYRVHGPKFLIEYCTTALTENHVHTAWRDLTNDFGEDLLAEHYRNNPH